LLILNDLDKPSYLQKIRFFAAIYRNKSMYSQINLERLKSDANTPQALQNVLSNFTWKRSNGGFRAKEHGGHSIYCKGGQWLFTAHNGNYKGGNVLAVVSDVHNLDLKTKDGLFEAANIVCQAANLNFSKYCTDAPSEAVTKYTPSVSRPIETKAFLPNTGQPLSKNFTFELATPGNYTHQAATKYYERKTGAKQAQNVVFLQSMTHIETGRKTVFSDKNLGIAYLSNGFAANIKVKVIDTETGKKKMFAIQNTGNYIFAYDSLPTENKENTTILICAGEDDATCINENLQPFGFYAISFGSESATIPSDILTYLRSQYKDVFTFYDADITGVKMAIRNKEQNGLPFISIGQFSELSDCKDVCDIYKKHGTRLLKAVIVSQTRRVFEQITRITATQGEYLSNILEKEGATFTGEFFNNTQIIAPTGSGKGVMISQIRGKKVVVCPTNALCQNYLKHGAIVHTGANFSDRDEVLNADFISTTHANLPNLLTIIGPQNYHCAVDESHNFTASASKKFMLKDLKRTLRLSNNFANRSFWTGTELYNFHSDFEGLKKIIVSIPKPSKSAQLVECKSVIQTTIDKAIESVKSGRFPIILLNNKKELLKQAIEGLKGYDFEVLNSDEKETAFFTELTETGNISSGCKGIITTSVIKEGNDIYNEFDFDFIVCNTHESIFHSVENEQLVNRARKAKSTNVFILKSINRKKVLDTFDPNECMAWTKRHTITWCNELNNTPPQYLPDVKNAQFGNDYAFIENEMTGKFELCELLLSFKVFEAERRFELSNEAYQRAQLEKYGFVFGDTIGDDAAESDELKEVFKVEREARKEQKRFDFEETKQDIIEQIESGNEVVLPNIDTASEGKRFAVSCFDRFTETGIQPEKVFELVNNESVTNDAHLGRLVKSISLFNLANDAEFMKDNSLTAIRIKLIQDSIKVGEKYSTGQLRGFMRRALNLEKGFNTRVFDKNTTSQQVLDFTRLFFKIRTDKNTGQNIVLGTVNFKEYIIESESIFTVPNALKNSNLQKRVVFSDMPF
jgi:hypothetical protein